MVADEDNAADNTWLGGTEDGSFGFGLLISKSFFVQEPNIVTAKMDTQTIFIFLRMVISFGIQQWSKQQW